ncbi:MAG TPA: hypothetical protein VND64_26345 [Pirellulales bacterium]|nr:hypothetical protein [Pirellulales bacterium]
MSQNIPSAAVAFSADPDRSDVESPFGTAPELETRTSGRPWVAASADEEEFDEDDFDDDFDDDFEDELDEELDDDLDEFDEDIEEDDIDGPGSGSDEESAEPFEDDAEDF